MPAMNTDNITVGFIGLGLIGGSIARTIRRIHPEAVIYAYDKDQAALKQAAADGVVSHPMEDVDEGFAPCSILFLCAPVSVNISYLEVIRSFMDNQCLLTDVGSVKGPMQEAVVRMGMEENFVGGHPMVGSERSGYEHSTDHLLENAYYFLTPGPQTNFMLSARFSSFIQGLGALPVSLPPQEHDYITAAISHVPHIIAAELVHLVRRADTRGGMLKQLAAGGFKDITRIASSSPVMWEQICQNNSPNIRALLNDMIRDLEEVIHQLDQENGDYVNHYFQEAGEYRNSVPDNATGLFEKIYKIYVDIPDEPGTLATVASQLAFHSISIKNIGIVHNREFEEGVLEIMLYDDESSRRAAQVLRERNYVVHQR